MTGSGGRGQESERQSEHKTGEYLNNNKTPETPTKPDRTVTEIDLTYINGFIKFAENLHYIWMEYFTDITTSTRSEGC